MSNLFSGANASLRGRTIPDGETIGRYGSYLDAQKAVDYLADHDFPVQHVSIVGNDLKSVEVVTGKLSYPRVALSGAASGAMFGLFIGLIFSLFGGGSGLTALIPSILIGAVFWMIIGVVTYAMQGGKRDFSSTSQVIASSFDIVVSREVAGQAREQLQNVQIRSEPVPGGPDPRGQQQGPTYGGPQGGPQYGGPQYGGQPQGQRGPQQGGQPQAGPWAPPQGQRPSGATPYGQPGQQYGQPGQQGQPGQPGQQGQQYGQPGAQGQQYGQPGQPGQQYGQPGQPGQQYGQPGAQGQGSEGNAYRGPAYQPQRGAGPAPSRAPRGADEPFDGQRAEQGGPAGQPSGARAAQPSGATSAQPSRPAPGQFPDLPDGRPQYGVRVEQGEQTPQGRVDPGEDRDTTTDAGPDSRPDADEDTRDR